MHTSLTRVVCDNLKYNLKVCLTVATNVCIMDSKYCNLFNNLLITGG